MCVCLMYVLLPHRKEIKQLMSELDEEKRIRLSLQVCLMLTLSTLPPSRGQFYLVCTCPIKTISCTDMIEDLN